MENLNLTNDEIIRVCEQCFLKVGCSECPIKDKCHTISHRSIISSLIAVARYQQAEIEELRKIPSIGERIREITEARRQGYLEAMDKVIDVLDINNADLHERIRKLIINI